MIPIRTVLLVAALLSPVASAAAQRPPSPGSSTTPSGNRLVGSDGTAPAQAFGPFDVVYPGPGQHPDSECAHAVDLSGIPELFIAASPLDPGVAVSCADKASRS